MILKFPRIETVDDLIEQLLKLRADNLGHKLIRIYDYNPDYYGNGLPIDEIEAVDYGEVLLLKTREE